ncbi:MAG: putative 4-hydroxybenzoate polyprenyltransferase [Saprospiraceae bacterium]|nr:putative 4-hydroxybenzoate polyprenyltransferase [Saprospiraceae bacterium]
MKNYLSLIKFSHTIFALPFALTGFFLAINLPGGSFSWFTLLLVVLCMVFARSAAMAFNRYLDRDIDSQNPRTANREIPAGVISPKAALTFVIINCVAFIATTWFINPLCFYLSPIALLVVLGYSYTKRFTWLCHFVLGLGLSLAPIGAYLAAGGGFDAIPILLSLVVLFWVVGFDVIYALQDEQFDQSQSLYSIPSSFGRKRGLRISEVSHALAAVFMLSAAYLMHQQYPGLQWIFYGGVLVFLGLLLYQHLLVKPNDLSKVNLAFFTTNGIASVIFASLAILDFYL